MSYVWKFILVAGAMAVTDAIWTLYLSSVADKKPMVAGISAALIYLCGAIVVTHYVNDFSLIAAAMMGSFVGTYATVRLKK